MRLLYAWCRHCDDVIDEQAHGRGHVPRGEDVLVRLAHLRERTAAALVRPQGTDAFAAIGQVATETGMPHALPLRHLDGFAMDAFDRRYRSIEHVLDYCHHVAGVVGRMMAIVMGVRPEDEAVLVRAADLGIAFQLTNIARDVLEDAANGRSYLPDEWLSDAGVPPGDHARPEHRAALVDVVERILILADDYYESAREGATHLPFRSAWAVLSAAEIYRAIGGKLRARGTHAWDERAYVPKTEKLRLLVKAAAEARAAPVALDRRRPLWTDGDSPRWTEPMRR